MTRPRTHDRLDPRLSGSPVHLADGESVVELTTGDEMCADDHGLVHGGFVFGLADHAAMLAVDEPTVVLAAADVRFTAPVRVGERLQAAAAVEWSEGKKRRVTVTVRRDEVTVFTGSFECYVPERHVLAARDAARGVAGDST